MLVVVDEVDDFLERDKLVFNICSNKANAFAKGTLDCYLETCRAVYRNEAPRVFLRAAFASSGNPEYWQHLHRKIATIHEEAQDKSKSVNKAFTVHGTSGSLIRDCVVWNHRGNARERGE